MYLFSLTFRTSPFTLEYIILYKVKAKFNPQYKLNNPGKDAATARQPLTVYFDRNESKCHIQIANAVILSIIHPNI